MKPLQNSPKKTKKQESKLFQDVDILMKLIPYFDIPLTQSKKIKPEANTLRKLLSLAKAEA